MGKVMFVGVVMLLLSLLVGAMGRKHSVGKSVGKRNAGASSFMQNFDVTWGGSNVQMSSDGSTVSLQLDQRNASSFASKNSYLFGYISTDIKLVPGNSAGTVVAYYLSSSSASHDELDFEFLGNVSGKPYIIQTNVFASGGGRREQRVYMWFDPTADYHSYSFLWNSELIVFYVDKIPIRLFKNLKSQGLAYPDSQPMTLYNSLWNGDTWATQGGAVRLNWTYAPFVASFRGFDIQACIPTQTNACARATGSWSTTVALTAEEQKQLSWVHQNYMIYNYCTDRLRYPTPPLECSYNLEV